MVMTKKHNGTLDKQPSQDIDGTTQNREDSTGPDSLQTERGLSAEERPDCPRFCTGLSAGKSYENRR